MSPVRLVCDSTADLEAGYAEAHDVAVVPLRVIFGEEELRDYVDISPSDFYARMRSSSVHPRTSQPTPAEFEAVFRRLGESGDPVICTTISEKMSGTFASASQARAALPDLDIRVVDTRTCTAGHNAAVRAAVARRDAGGDAASVVGDLERLRQRQRVAFTVESLEYLRRGGRIGNARALLGTVLNIKPVLEVVDGSVEPLDRVRTFPRAIDRLFTEVEKARDKWGAVELMIAHADCRERADQLAERGEALLGSRPLVIEVGPVIGCHAGPGAIGFAFQAPLSAGG